MLPAVPQTHQPRATAGRWTLLRHLGEGSSGSTWLAVDAAGVEAALKWLPEPPGNELRALASLVHPSIPALLGAGSHPMAYVVMERATGRLASEVLEHGRADSLLVAHTLTGLSSALALAHGRGIIHGDVSAANVCIDDDRAWLLDFGMVGSREGGTPEYMAPERFEGQGGPAADVYALGLVCWALLEGRSPPPIAERTTAPPDQVVNGPPWLADLVASMLHPEPAMRPTAAEVAQECTGRGVEAPVLDRLALVRRAHALFLERPVHARLRRWFAHRDLLAVVGSPGHGVGHTARWAVDELLAAGALVIDVGPGGSPLEPLRRLAADPRLVGPAAELDLHATKGLVFDTADRILARIESSVTLVVRGDGLAQVCVDVLAELAKSPHVSLLWTGRTAPSWISEQVALGPWPEDALTELATQLLGVDRLAPDLHRVVARAKGVPAAVLEPLVEGMACGAVQLVGTTWHTDAAAVDALCDAVGRREVGLSGVAGLLGAAFAAWGRELPVETALRWTEQEALPVAVWKDALQELVVAGFVRVDGSVVQVLGEGARQQLLDHAMGPLLQVVAFSEGEAQGVSGLHWIELAVGARVSAILARRAPELLRALILEDPDLGLRWTDAVWATCTPEDRTGELALERVRALVSLLRNGEAEAWLDEVPADVRSSARALVAIGYLTARLPDEMVRVLGEPWPEEPAPLRMARTQLLGALGRLDDAQAMLDTVNPGELDPTLRAELPVLHAKVARVSGDPDRALAILESCEHITARWHDERASTYLAVGLAREAAPHFLKAARLPGWSTSDRASMMHQAGFAWFTAGDLVPAVEAFEAASSVFQRIGNPKAFAAALVNISTCAQRLGRLGVARESAQRAQESLRQLPNDPRHLMFYSNLVDLDLSEGLLGLAREHLATAKALHRELELPWNAELARRELDVRHAHGETGLLGEVQRTAERAAEVGEHGESAMLRLLEGRLALRSGTLDAARVHELYEQASGPLIAAGRSSDLADTRAGFAELFLATDDMGSAETLASQARTWAEEFQRRPLRAQADRVLARVQEVAVHHAQDADRLGRLVQLSVEILGEHDPRRVMEAIAQAARDLTGADRAFVVRVQADEGVPPSTLHGHDITEEHTDEVLFEDVCRPVIVASSGALAEDRPSWTVVRRCMASQREVLVRDLAERDDLNKARSVRKMRLQAALAVPFDLQGKLYGVIYVDRVGGSFERMKASVGVLRFLASYAGVAVTNAQAMERHRRRAELAEEVLHDARNLLQPLRDFGDGVDGVPSEDLRATARTVVSVAQRFTQKSEQEEPRRKLRLDRLLPGWLRAYAPIGAERQVALDLQVEVDASERVTVFGTATDLQRAVGNLVGNGVKYAPRGSVVSVRLDSRPLDDAPDVLDAEPYVLIDVIDAGPGVPRGYEERIFEREAQAVGARHGLGLGLSIARRIARSHGGDVTVVPSGRGGHFRLRLPIYRPDAEPSDEVLADGSH